jgi:hypothetical protein
VLPPDMLAEHSLEACQTLTSVVMAP